MKKKNIIVIEGTILSVLVIIIVGYGGMLWQTYFNIPPVLDVLDDTGEFDQVETAAVYEPISPEVAAAQLRALATPDEPLPEIAGVQNLQALTVASTTTAAEAVDPPTFSSIAPDAAFETQVLLQLQALGN